jgi:flagella basal body P-ring formation protein FlgA
MRVLFFVLISLFVRSAGAEFASVRPEISILSNPTTTVTAGQPVRLSDLGGASFVSNEVQKKAQNLIIIESIGDGEEKLYTNVQMVRLLKEKIAAQSDLASLNWTYFVPERIRVIGKTNSISENRLSNEILSLLQDKCAACSFRLQDLKVPQIKETSSLTGYELETSSLKTAGGFLLPLRVSFADGAKTYYVTGQVVVKAKALVTARSVNMGEKISMKDVRTEEVDLTYSNDAFATSEDLAGMTAARMLQMGRPIYKSDLKKEVVVLRGQVIRAISGNEAFEVSAQAVAEENGAVGDSIKLKNTETQKQMSGQVVDRGVVRIQ